MKCLSARAVSVKNTLSRGLSICLLLFVAFTSFPGEYPCFADDQLLIPQTIFAKGSDTYVPYSYLNEEGDIDGFNNELFQAVADVAGLKVNIELEEWSKIRKELESRKIDVITAMYHSKERDKLVDFSVPHIIVKYSIFVRKDSDIKSLADLDGKEIIVMRGAISHDYLKEKGIAGKIVSTKDTATALSLLASGQHDCALLVRLQGLYLMKKHGIENIKAIGEPLNPQKFCFAVKEGDSVLLARLNEGLFVLKETGKYDEIYDKWFGILKQETSPQKQTLRYTVFVMVPLLALLLGVVLWTWSLRRQVDQRTKELYLEIAEHKKAEIAQKNSEARLESIIRVAPIGIGVVIDRIFHTVNDRICEMTGFSKEELIGKSARVIYPSDEEYERVGRNKYTDIGKYGTGHIETKFKRKDGEIIDVLLSSTPINPDDLSEGVTFTALDITDRKKAEEALREERDKAQQYLDIAGVMFVVLHADQSVALINKKGCEILEYGEEEIIGKNWFDSFIPGIDREETRAGFYELIAGNIDPIEYFENAVLTKNKEQRIIAWHNAVLRDEQGNIKGTVSSGEDITDRKRTEEALRDSETKYRELVQTANSIIFRMDTDGNILFFNEFAQSFFGYEGDEILGKNLVGTIVPETDSAGRDLSAMIQDILRHPDRYATNENENVRKNGDRVWVAWTNKGTYDENENIVEILSIGNDITDRKRLERELRQAQKMEAIGTLAGGIAHDFNNILMVLMLNAEMAMMDLPDESPQRFHIEEAMKAGDRAKDLVKQILTFSRQTEVDPKPLKISLIIKEALNLLRSSLPTTIEIRKGIESQLSTVLADPTQIHQVMMNLCTNAAHAMQETGGILAVTLSDIDVDEEIATKYHDLKPGLYVKLSVKDTGPGIEPENIERIFEPYFTTKEKGQGTGMGLAIVHGIVTGYEGAIAVESEVGKGTIFHALFPRLEAVSKPKTEPKKPIPTGHESILFIDDEKAMVEAGRAMLERLGYEITTRTSSIEALEAFRHNPDKFDLVITDMTMPNMTGANLAKEIMKIRPDMPVILCTGFSDTIDEAKAKMMGIKAFIMKPIITNELANTIREVLDKEIIQP